MPEDLAEKLIHSDIETKQQDRKGKEAPAGELLQRLTHVAGIFPAEALKLLATGNLTEASVTALEMRNAILALRRSITNRIVSDPSYTVSTDSTGLEDNIILKWSNEQGVLYSENFHVAEKELAGLIKNEPMIKAYSDPQLKAFRARLEREPEGIELTRHFDSGDEFGEVTDEISIGKSPLPFGLHELTAVSAIHGGVANADVNAHFGSRPATMTELKQFSTAIIEGKPVPPLSYPFPPIQF